MRSQKVVVSKMRERGLRMIGAVALGAAMLALGGCSSSSPPDSATANPAMALNFSLDKCQQLDANLYKCPAIDQPICTPEFTRADVNCVHTGPKGSVFVQRQGANP